MQAKEYAKNKECRRLEDLILFSIRIKDTARRKLKIVAGYKDSSINAEIQKLIDKEISEWEKRHGEIKLPQD